MSTAFSLFATEMFATEIIFLILKKISSWRMQNPKTKKICLVIFRSTSEYHAEVPLYRSLYCSPCLKLSKLSLKFEFQTPILKKRKHFLFEM